MNRENLLIIVKQSYAAFGNRDVEELCRLSTQDCIFQAPGIPKLMPWAQKHVGHGGIRHFVAALDTHLKFSTFVAHEYIADETTNSVVALGRAECVSRSTGRSYTNHWAHLFKLVNGKIAHFQEFPDTAAQLVAVHPIDLIRYDNTDISEA